MSTDIISLAKMIQISVSSLRTFEEKFPVLQGILAKSKHPYGDWRFYMTVAGTGFYMLKYENDPEKLEIYAKTLSELYGDFPAGLDNFFHYMELKEDSDLNIDSKIGFWVLWNIAGEPPSHDEAQSLAPALGVYLEKVVSDLATSNS
jgi:hypothetical protein